MEITKVQQQIVWAVPEIDLSDAAKAVWQAMADYGQGYNSVDAAVVISAQMGGSISEAEVTNAINELWTKGYLLQTSFEAKFPDILLPTPT